jgi:hypothetical protein
MALIDREVGVAVAATAGLLSPRAREVARKGAVYGLAGVMKVGDVVVGGARGAARGATEGAAGSNGKAPEHAGGSAATDSSGTGEPIPQTGGEPPAADETGEQSTRGSTATSKRRRSSSSTPSSSSSEGATL